MGGDGAEEWEGGERSGMSVGGEAALSLKQQVCF